MSEDRGAVLLRELSALAPLHSDRGTSETARWLFDFASEALAHLARSDELVEEVVSACCALAERPCSLEHAAVRELCVEVAMHVAWSDPRAVLDLLEPLEGTSEEDARAAYLALAARLERGDRDAWIELARWAARLGAWRREAPWAWGRARAEALAMDGEDAREAWTRALEAAPTDAWATDAAVRAARHGAPLAERAAELAARAGLDGPWRERALEAHALFDDALHARRDPRAGEHARRVLGWLPEPSLARVRWLGRAARADGERGAELAREARSLAIQLCEREPRAPIEELFTPPTAEAPFGPFFDPARLRAWSRGPVSDPADLASRALFGPREDLRCECGTAVDWARFAEVCEACGVERTLHRTAFTRTAHVTFATPLLHPYAEAVLASLLAASREQMMALRRHEAHVAHALDPHRRMWLEDGPAPRCAGHEPLLEALRELDPARSLHHLAGTVNEPVMQLLARGEREGTRPEHMMLLALPVPPIEAQWGTPRGRFVRSLVDRQYGAILAANRAVMETLEVRDESGFAAAAAALQLAVDRVFWALSTREWLPSRLDLPRSPRG